MTAGKWLAAGATCIALVASASVAPADQPQPRWTATDIKELVSLIDQSQGEGLRPTDYDIEALIGGLIGGKQDLDAVADRAALTLAHDFLEGSAPAEARRDWHIVRPSTDYGA